MCCVRVYGPPVAVRQAQAGFLPCLDRLGLAGYPLIGSVSINLSQGLPIYLYTLYTLINLLFHAISIAFSMTPYHTLKLQALIAHFAVSSTSFRESLTINIS